MHLLSREAGAIQQEGEAIDLGQSPAPIVFASAADSELAMLAGAVDRAGQARVSGRGVEAADLRLANLLRLSHNLSVDLWLEQTVRHAKLVVIRLLGGPAYWQYGVDELTALALGGTINLALLPGDANSDPILQDRSTVHPDDWSRLHALFTAGGPENADAILTAFGELAVGTTLPLAGREAEQDLALAKSVAKQGGGLPHAPGSPPATPDPSPRGGGRRLKALTPNPFPRFGLWYPGQGMVNIEGLAEFIGRASN